MESSEVSENNRRIVKNTLVIYVNMFLNLLIGLLSSRLVLQALGVSDYGLYHVVGGIVFLFAFISESLSSTTVRFINVEKGKKDGDVNRIFNVCRVLHGVMAIILFLLLEIVGVQYINHYLNVDPGKEGDAMFVFQVVTIMWCVGITNVPYSSLFNANEKFIFDAVITLIGKLILLALVFGLLHYGGNRIRAYSIIMTTSTVIQYVAYHVFCYRYWPTTVKWKFVKKWNYYKEAVVFSNFNLLSGASTMARGQGCTLLINFFFGTTVNGAYAVATALQGYVSSFANKFFSAAIPQVTQNYGCQNFERVYYLTSRVGKYAFLLFLLFFFPLWAELGFILHLWLGVVPVGALTFSKLTLLMAFVVVSDVGIWNIVNASGELAKFRTVYSLLTLSCVPVGFIMLKAGASAYTLPVLFIVADVIWRFTQLGMARRILQFPVGRLCRDTYLPVVKVILPVILCIVLTSMLPWHSTLWHLGRTLLIFGITASLAYSVGLKEDERKRIKDFLSAVVRRLWIYIIVPPIGIYYRRKTRYNNTGKVALCCIAKIENDYIRFFVEYYKKLHFDKIILYDNNELDGERFEDVIGDYIHSQFVEIINFRGKEAPQLEAYQDCYDRYNKEYDWIAFFDCDEFLTFVDGYTDIHTFLNQPLFLQYQVVHVNWKVYGDNGLLDTDGRSVIERFKEPITPFDFKTPFTDFPENNHVKSLVRGGLYHIKWKGGAHTPRNYYYRCCNANGEKVRLHDGRHAFDFRVAYLRHYSTKTIGEWVRTKMKRGDVFYVGEKAKQMTSIEFFFRYNQRTEEKIRYAQTLLSSYNPK